MKRLLETLAAVTLGGLAGAAVCWILWQALLELVELVAREGF